MRRSKRLARSLVFGTALLVAVPTTRAQAGEERALAEAALASGIAWLAVDDVGGDVTTPILVDVLAHRCDASARQA